jgi:hypothetical protein
LQNDYWLKSKILNEKTVELQAKVGKLEILSDEKQSQVHDL